ncbi:MAG TPA: hypothetical protein VGO20_18040, partial [Arenibaculum sp.]|nr:hypothetical protein [Arenibaculum sp.]
MQPSPFVVLPAPTGPDAPILSAAQDVLLARAADQGVRIHLSHGFGDLLRVNERAIAAGTWDAIIRTVDCRFRRLGPDNAFWLAALDDEGAP